jgi:putative phosphoesterase
MRIGLISDTHGLLRPQALAFLEGCSRIIHGGDIGSATVLQELQLIAPVTAVRGNNDDDEWAVHLRDTELVELNGVRIAVVHQLADLRIDLPAEGIQVVVCGHSHKPLINERQGVIFVNPGSAGPRRFKLPVSVGELLIEKSSARARLFRL